MDENRLRVNNIEKPQQIKRFPKKKENSRQREKQKKDGKTFTMEKSEEQPREKKPTSTIWELYQISLGDQTKKAELTGSNIHDLYKMTQGSEQNSSENKSLMWRLYQNAIQNDQSKKDELTENGVTKKRVRTLDSSNYEKYNHSK